ncbi:MAG: hypothetical protein ACPLXC_02705 [Candidatus Pacearchaeota archaeon]
MGLQEFLKSLSEDNSEKSLQRITDSILDFFIFAIPKTVTDFYKKQYDSITLSRFLKEKEKGKSFCEKDYKAGEIVCKYSKYFYDKNLMSHFCKDSNRQDTSKIIKKKGALFHRGYCLCSLNNQNNQ